MSRLAQDFPLGTNLYVDTLTSVFVFRTKVVTNPLSSVQTDSYKIRVSLCSWMRPLRSCWDLRNKALREFFGKLLGNRFGIGLCKDVYMSSVLNVSWKFGEFNPQTVSNLIMHHRKSQCDLYRSSGRCVPLWKTAFCRSLPLFPFCKAEVAVLPLLGEEYRTSTVTLGLQMFQG